MVIKIEAKKQILFGGGVPDAVVSIGTRVLATRVALVAELVAEGLDPDEGHFYMEVSPGGGYVDLKWTRP